MHLNLTIVFKFKKVLIFVAIKESNSVSLDILTLSDLEKLRSKKLSNNSATNRQSNTAIESASNMNKRFLILTYNVEFDR